MLTINNFIWLQIKNKSFIYQLLAKHRTEAQTQQKRKELGPPTEEAVSKLDNPMDKG